MTLHVAVVGIEGSGSTSLVSALPAALAQERGIASGAAGEDFCVAVPDPEDPVLGSDRKALPWLARLAKLVRRFYSRDALLPKMIRDGAARRLAHRYRPDVVVSDGNALLWAAGRGTSGPVSVDEASRLPDASELLDLFDGLRDGVPMSADQAARFPVVAQARSGARLLSFLDLDGLWLPDMVLMVDLPPDEALERLRERGGGGESPASAEELRQAREVLLTTLEAFAASRSVEAALRLPVSGSSTEETLDAVVAWIELQLEERSLETATAATSS